ncbi:hypothetical protein BJ170DRAFT_642768 [Xylariales sp. AK1849]|nr:hypothetical protein BJ170DRAFT_642768 [Xylariales sp. AK1849]
MVTLRISNSLSAVRVARHRAPQTYRTFFATPRVLAQGYGDGEGDPVGEKPQKQPGASSAQESSEHPGPAPPDVGKGTGGGPTKASMSQSMDKAADAADPADASAQSGGSRSKEAEETGSSPTGGEVANKAARKGGEALKGPQGAGTPQPKIHNQAIPGTKAGLSEEQKREVEQHNEEFEKRHDRAQPAEQDKVNKGFWKGSGGRDGT